MQSYRIGSADERERGIEMLERKRVHEALRARLFGAKPATIQVARFELKQRLGAGAMGIVYVAHDPQLQREVALKILNGTGLSGGDTFLHEARALARLSHPNVLQIYEAGLHDGAPYLVSELLHGGTFRSWMSASKRPWKEVLRMLVSIGIGLNAAHQRGLVHRDIKPENVLIDGDGRPRVADFGLALVPVSQPLQGLGGHIAGTLRYMAPEQMRGERVEPASDQFSFCVMAFEALFGCFPFEGETIGDLLAAASREVLPEIPKNHPAYAALPALRRGLRASLPARFPSMVELLAELEKILRSKKGVWLGLLAVALLSGSVASAWSFAQRPIVVEFGSEKERAIYQEAMKLSQAQKFKECTSLLQKYPKSENLMQFRLGCARGVPDPAVMEGLCVDWERYLKIAPPDDCAPHVRQAQRLKSAGRYGECISLIERNPFSIPAYIVMSECAAKNKTSDGYLRACNYNRKANPSLPPCQRIVQIE